MFKNKEEAKIWLEAVLKFRDKLDFTSQYNVYNLADEILEEYRKRNNPEEIKRG